MAPVRTLFVATLVATASQLPAQGVTLKATALTELKVTSTSYGFGFPFTSTDTLPAGTDLTGGADLRAATGYAQARTTLQTLREPWGIVVRLNESANASAATLGNAGNADIGPHRIQVELFSPRPVKARLTVRHCRGEAGFSATGYDGQLDIPGHGTVPAGASCDDPIIQSFEVVIDTTPLIAIIDSEGFAFPSASSIPNYMTGFWQLELVPDPTFPCEIESYGDACGATLTTTTDLDHPGQLVVSLRDPSLPQVAALTLGGARAATPIIGTSCTLYHDLQVLLFPWPVDAAGRAELVFTPPPIPGLSFKMQAATLRGTTIHATNGVDAVICH